MEPASQKMTFLYPSVVALGSLLLSGCLALDKFQPPADEPLSGPVCQLVTIWNKEVVFTPDPANSGVPRPGIAGRLYLFGPEIDYPRAGAGSLTVELYQPGEKTEASGTDGKLLEQWRIDPATLSRLLRKDMIGWGYTLFLPWGSYRPEITQVWLKVRYDPPQGALLYTISDRLTLTTSKPPVQ